MSRTENIEVYKNTAVSVDFIIKDENGTVVNLTGSTGTFRAYLNIPGSNDSDVISKAITITNAITGEVTVSLTDTNTDIDVAVYNYELVFDFGADDTRVLGFGSLIIKGDDTQRIQQIKKKYGFDYEYHILRSAHNWAKTQILNNAFEFVCLDYTSAKTVFELNNYVMDKNFDGSITASDITIREFLSKSPYTVNDLSGNISSVTFDHPMGKSIVVMDGNYPSASGYTLRIEYYKGVQSYSDAIEDIQSLEELYTILKLMDILEPHQLQRGLPERSINGVTLRFDREGIAEYKKQLKKQIQNIILKLLPLNSGSVVINKGYDRTGFDISSLSPSR